MEVTTLLYSYSGQEYSHFSELRHTNLLKSLFVVHHAKQQ